MHLGLQKAEQRIGPYAETSRERCGPASAEGKAQAVAALVGTASTPGTARATAAIVSYDEPLYARRPTSGRHPLRS